MACFSECVVQQTKVGFRTQSGMDDAEGKRWGSMSVMLIWIFEEQGTNDCEGFVVS